MKISELVEKSLQSKVKESLDTKTKSCRKCMHLDYVEDADSDGYVNQNNSGWECGKRYGVQNLKSFPFKKEMKCFEAKTNSLEEC